MSGIARFITIASAVALLMPIASTGQAATVSFLATGINGEPIDGGPAATISVIPGDSIIVEAYAAGWHPQYMRAYTVGLDSTNFNSGSRGALTPYAAGTLVDVTRTDGVFFGLAQTPLTQTDTPDFRNSSVLLSAGDAVTDPQVPVYLGTFAVDVSIDARGVFELVPDLRDLDGDELPDTQLINTAYTTIQPLVAGGLTIEVEDLCGNGAPDYGEVCDDGNDIEGDGCDSNCTLSACGNGVTAPGEACDDGNDTNGDGCDNNCTLTACGNGIAASSEACDDGNLADGDGCDHLCAIETGLDLPRLSLLAAAVNGVPLPGGPSAEVYADGEDFVTIEAYASQWDPELLRGFQVGLDPVDYTSGDAGALIPVEAGTMIDDTRSDYVFFGLIATPAVATFEPEFRLMSALNLPGDSVPDEGGAYYLGTFEIQLSADAAGMFHMAPSDVDHTGGDNPSYTSLHTPDAQRITPLKLLGTTIVTERLCGNGALDAGEDCDDGNAVSGDGCDSNCTNTGCGNGIITAGEACDDGNLIDGDGCQGDCTLPACGNGTIDDGEDCDDGNLLDGDGCDSNCTDTGCGNGIVTSSEACDDGNLINGDGCSDQCAFELPPTMSLIVVSANGIPLPGGPSDRVYAAAGSTFVVEAYAEGFAPHLLRGYEVGIDERCYSSGPAGTLLPVASLVDIDTGRADWAFAGIAALPAVDTSSPGHRFAATTLNAADSIVDPGSPVYLGTFGVSFSTDAAGVFSFKVDQRDADSDGTPEHALLIKQDATPMSPVVYNDVFLIAHNSLCGNGTIDAGEACDDGNAIHGDGCDNDCTITTCGNGTIDEGENCDDSNTIDDDGCDSNCRTTGCGNGIVTSGEVCDDGNTINGDGCSDVCQVEIASCTTDLDCALVANNCCEWNACDTDLNICKPGVLMMYGDVAGTSFGSPPNGVVNLTDVLCVLNAFGVGNLGNCPNADVAGLPVPPAGCPSGNGVVNLTDILKVLNAFGAPNAPTATFACNCAMNPT